MSESLRETITTMLNDHNSSAAVSDELMPLLYKELRGMAARQLANERADHTLQPTALVHEAYLKLVGDPNMRWDSRGHFFVAAARSMRQILINHARDRKAQKRGGTRKREALIETAAQVELEPGRMLDLDEALQRLEEQDPRKAQVVMLRFFAGLSVEEIGAAMDISPATVKRDWQFSRTWLYHEMSR